MTTPQDNRNSMEGCECEKCCDGEHAGECAECAGWGSLYNESSERYEACERCDGTGTCPVCNGACFRDDA